MSCEYILLLLHDFVPIRLTRGKSTQTMWTHEVRQNISGRKNLESFQRPEHTVNNVDIVSFMVPARTRLWRNDL